MGVDQFQVFIPEQCGELLRGQVIEAFTTDAHETCYPLFFPAFFQVGLHGLEQI